MWIGWHPILAGISLCERFEDERPRGPPPLQRVGYRVGRGAPDVAAGGLRAAERGVERQFLAVQLDPQSGHQLAEQPRPGGLTRYRLLGQDLLLGLGEEMRPVAPRAAQMVAAEVKSPDTEDLLRLRVIHCRPLALEEQEPGLDLGSPLLHHLKQRAALGIGGVGREAKGCEGAGAADELLDRLELVPRLGRRSPTAP